MRSKLYDGRNSDESETSKNKEELKKLFQLSKILPSLKKLNSIVLYGVYNVCS